MFYSTRAKLIASFLAVVFLVGFVSLLIGGQLLYESVLGEAKNRVRLDLNTAREIYLNRIKSIACPISVSSMEPALQVAVKKLDVTEIIPRLQIVKNRADLDFIGVVNKEGKMLCRIGRGDVRCETVEVKNPIAELVFARLVSVSGTIIVSKSFLAAHSLELADMARVRRLPVTGEPQQKEEVETSGMVLVAAFPIFDKGNIIGVLYGGALLNRSDKIVDTVRNTVFQNEIYKGRNVGTATIFFKDMRISTNVLTPKGARAIGTQVSREVKEHVLVKGERWTGRALVVSDWYITAYEPIEDIFGSRVGMLYTGVLEEQYVDIRNKALFMFIIITAAGMLLAIGLGYFLSDRFTQPVNRLIKASQEVSEGNLNPEIGPISSDEIGVLQTTFRDMVLSLKDRDRRRNAESENRLLQSEKQASVGRLAAGVAHEINNPLTGVLTYTHMLLRRKDLGDDIRSDLEVIVQSTERVRKIVKGLLDFSRQTKLDREPTDVNRLVRATVSMMENQALVKGVSINFNNGEALPQVTLDRSQIQSVLLNMILNALDATEPGDSININTATDLSASEPRQMGVEITIADNGCGIPPENLDKLFDPFFTTKEVGQGTGLGLSVSLGIVHEHGGAIRVQSKPGKGTRFFIWLPVEKQHSETA
ncbi:MAG: cache domain-containing protein [Syntrophales bacterium]|jgi:two-component system NtrC family sensor kinase|nr:cache domain-containing protein [Syntrophales bacterium]